MKSRLHLIEIRFCKVFREFPLNLGTRHLLVYSPNGLASSSGNLISTCGAVRLLRSAALISASYSAALDAEST